MSAYISYSNISSGEVHSAPRKGYAASIAWLTRTTIRLLPICLLIFLLAGCQNSHSQEAAEVAERGSETATELATYYHQMATDASELPMGQAIREKIINASIPDVTPASVETIRDANELEGDYAAREQMAQNLQNLYEQFGKLAESKPDDVIGAASNLQAAVQNVNDNHPLKVSLVAGHEVPDALVQAHLQKLISYLYQLQKTPKLREGNEKASLALTELTNVFEEEEPVYLSNGHLFATLGYRITKSLKNKGAATVNVDILSATSPIQGLLAPYPIQATGSHADVLSDADEAAADLKIEKAYREAAADARNVPERLRASLTAQAQRQSALQELLKSR